MPLYDCPITTVLFLYFYEGKVLYRSEVFFLVLFFYTMHSKQTSLSVYSTVQYTVVRSILAETAVSQPVTADSRGPSSKLISRGSLYQPSLT